MPNVKHGIEMTPERLLMLKQQRRQNREKELKRYGVKSVVELTMIKRALRAHQKAVPTARHAEQLIEMK